MTREVSKVGNGILSISTWNSIVSCEESARSPSRDYGKLRGANGSKASMEVFLQRDSISWAPVKTSNERKRVGIFEHVTWPWVLPVITGVSLIGVLMSCSSADRGHKQARFGDHTSRISLILRLGMGNLGIFSNFSLSRNMYIYYIHIYITHIFLFTI